MLLYREAELLLKSALDQQETVALYHYISKVYIKLDQPLQAIAMYKKGLNRFAGEVTLLIGIARIYEVCTVKFIYINFSFFVSVKKKKMNILK